MSGRWQALFAFSVVSALTLYLVLGAGPAFAEPSDLLGASSDADASVMALQGQVDDTCDEVDDTTDEDACDEGDDETGETTGQGTQQADDTCDEVDDTTDQATCDEDEALTEQGDQQSGTTNQNSSNQTTKHHTTKNQTANTQSTSQTTTNEHANSQSSNEPQANNPNTDGPLARAGRWVGHVANRLGDVIGGLVGRLADLVGGGDPTKASNRNPEDAAGNDRSGESASAPSAGHSEREGDPPSPWWEAWLPFTGSQWLLAAAVVALVLIGVGVALRSMGRRRRFPRVGQV
jgi:cobalamin biosynthesis Mg chelatase CobN